jgi:putative solute:sodium symporter small subunit
MKQTITMEQTVEHKQISAAQTYWRLNVRLMVKLLTLWFFVSFVCGILLVDVLNKMQIGGYKLGFWFAQQGSMYCFVVIVFYYTRRMARLDRQFGGEE